MMTFEELNLNKQLLNALTENGYLKPTPIQEKVFAVVMSGKDVCGIAQTGTGKTFAYLLPCLRQFQYAKDRSPQILILVPTRELVAQVIESIQKLGTYMNILPVGVYGGINMKTQVAQIIDGANILVATPGRLVDLLMHGVIKTKAIKKLVIDEVDEMLNLGFRSQLKVILDLLPEKRQNLLFSATITEDVELLIEQYFNSPIRVEAAPTGTPLENISQTAYLVPNFYTKVNLLKLVLAQSKEMNKVLVFVATKQLADDIYEQLSAEFPQEVGVIHSNKAQNNRFATVKKFKSGEYRIIIATDIIARGLDVAEVSHVFNFDIPEVPENYIHRIGRTGRVDKKGIALTFITPRDIEAQERIETLMNYTIPLLELPENLVISDVLTEDEKPKIAMKMIEVKLPSREGVGASFHEKSEKNKKVNVRKNYEDDMKKKYGKSYKGKAGR